ncbi:hypothetical protein KJ966_20730 [bacterium]|nr:hypothetical protein [bacterium]
MKYEFSQNTDIKQFAEPDFENKVYFGFASPPQKNTFSQKHDQKELKTKLNSTTQTLRHYFDLLKLSDDREMTIVIHTVRGFVTLDLATASLAATLSKQDIRSAQWELLAAYVQEIESGICRPPFLRSLYAFFSASKYLARSQYDDEQLHEMNMFALEKYWEVVQAVLKKGKIKDMDSLHRFMDLIPKEIEIVQQEEALSNEVNRYMYQDIPRTERFEIELPLRKPKSSNRFARVNLLAVTDPQSELFKFFARNPMVYKDEGEKCFEVLYIRESKNRGKMSEHVISIQPNEDFHLAGLSDLLDHMEDDAHERQALPDRSKDNPREGYDYNDPWYDERHSNRTIVDTPKEGSYLEWNDILEALWAFGAPLKTIKPTYVGTSVFIPLWTPPQLHKLLSLDRSKWHPSTPDRNALKWFFPFVESIFTTSEITGMEDPLPTLNSYEYQSGVELTLQPEFGEFESFAINFNQKKGLKKSRRLLEDADIKLLFHQYEYGLGFFEIIIQTREKSASIMDTQWLEQCISLTPFSALLQKQLRAWERQFNKQIPDLVSAIIKRLEMPNKHYVCSTLTGFNYEGGYLVDGRSTGGALQMMVCDENPLYKNLPTDERIVTEFTVVDITSKRHYFCSSSSLLNFDNVGNAGEHRQAHEASRIIFNMVMAQRFILSKSRMDIVLAERAYHEKRNLSLLGLLKQSVPFLGKGNDIIEISQLRDDIQHMTTSSWFQVISNKKAIQDIFYKIREAMEINQIYEEVKDRCTELDEFIKKKESAKQSKIFGFFAFIISPLSLITGFAGGLEYNTWNYEKGRNPFSLLTSQSPLLESIMSNIWGVIAVFSLASGLLFLIVFIIFRWLSSRD